MDEQSRFVHIDSVLRSPTVQLIPVYTLVSCSICARLEGVGLPAVYDQSDVAVADRKPSQGIDAVF